MSQALPVRIWGMDSDGRPFTQPATTLDVTAEGACLDGVRASLKTGDVIGVEFHGSKGRFAVAWVGEQASPRKGQIGIRGLEPGKSIWGAALAAAKSNPVAPPAAAGGDGRQPPPPPHGVERREQDRRREERRRNPRHKCTGGVEFRAQGMNVRVWGNLSDVSLGGCYADMMSPLAVGTHVETTLTACNLEVRTAAVVRVSHPGCGMGVEFAQLSAESIQSLRLIVSRLEAAAAKEAVAAETGKSAEASANASWNALPQQGYAASVLQSLLMIFGEKNSMTREEFQQVLERARSLPAPR
ncbi:MAG: PilZ domain-containing protein [Terriglobales bacterium]